MKSVHPVKISRSFRSYSARPAKIIGFGDLAPVTTSFQDTEAGWTVGTGVESRLQFFNLIGKNWTIKTECLYADLGSVTNGAVAPPTSVTHNMAIQEHIFRTGINHFT